MAPDVAIDPGLVVLNAIVAAFEAGVDPAVTPALYVVEVVYWNVADV